VPLLCLGAAPQLERAESLPVVSTTALIENRPMTKEEKQAAIERIASTSPFFRTNSGSAIARSPTTGSTTNQSAKAKTDELLQWCKMRTEGYAGVNVTNFSKSWWDGLAFCALLHRYNSRLVDFASLDPNNKRHNLKLAFDTAERLGVPRLLDEEDMIDTAPESKSVMTYLFELRRVLK